MHMTRIELNGWRNTQLLCKPLIRTTTHSELNHGKVISERRKRQKVSEIERERNWDQRERLKINIKTYYTSPCYDIDISGYCCCNTYLPYVKNSPKH